MLHPRVHLDRKDYEYGNCAVDVLDRVEWDRLRKPSTEGRPLTIPLDYPTSSSPDRVSGSPVYLYGIMIIETLSQHGYLNPGSNTLDNCNGQNTRSCTSSAGIVRRLLRSVGMKVPVKRPPVWRSQATTPVGSLQFRSLASITFPCTAEGVFS